MDELLLSILSVQSYSGSVKQMNKLITRLASDFGATVRIVKKNIYVTKGVPEDGLYPCIASHTDTVHKILPASEYRVGYDAVQGICFGWNPVKRDFTGIGGDDKVGIYIALCAVRDYDVMKAVFFRDEENGCNGSKECDLTFFNDCRYILQCDRRGSTDFVNKISQMDISSKDFQADVEPIIKQYGYSFATGMTTDVGQLTSRNVGVSTANMSCGYYNPHNNDEVIVIADVERTRKMVYDICDNLIARYPNEYIAPVYTTTTYGGGGKQGILAWGAYGTGGYKKNSANILRYQTNVPERLLMIQHCPLFEDLKTMTKYDLILHAHLVKAGYTYLDVDKYQRNAYNSTWEIKRCNMVLSTLDSMLTEEQVAECLDFYEYLQEIADMVQYGIQDKTKPSGARDYLPAEFEEDKKFFDGILEEELAEKEYEKYAGYGLEADEVLKATMVEGSACRSCQNELMNWEQRDYIDQCHDCASGGIL